MKWSGFELKFLSSNFAFRVPLTIWGLSVYFALPMSWCIFKPCWSVDVMCMWFRVLKSWLWPRHHHFLAPWPCNSPFCICFLNYKIEMQYQTYRGLKGSNEIFVYTSTFRRLFRNKEGSFNWLSLFLGLVINIQSNLES